MTEVVDHGDLTGDTSREKLDEPVAFYNKFQVELVSRFGPDLALGMLAEGYMQYGIAYAEANGFKLNPGETLETSNELFNATLTLEINE